MNMSMTKLKVCTAVALGAAVVAALVGGSLLPVVSAQEKLPGAGDYITRNQQGGTGSHFIRAKQETDEAFIRRISKDLRGTGPTPAEVHFFVTSKEPGKRQKLIDLFIKERQARREAVQKSATKRADEEAQLVAFALKHASALEMARSLVKLVEKKGAQVVAEERGNRLLVRARKDDMPSIRKLVEALDALAESKEKEGTTGRKK